MTSNILTKVLPQEKHYFCMKELDAWKLSKILSKPNALISKVDNFPIIQGSIHVVVTCIRSEISNISYKYCGFNHYFPYGSLFRPQSRPKEFSSPIISPLFTPTTYKCWSGKRYEHKQKHELKLMLGPISLTQIWLSIIKPTNEILGVNLRFMG